MASLQLACWLLHLYANMPLLWSLVAAMDAIGVRRRCAASTSGVESDCFSLLYLGRSLLSKYNVLAVAGYG